MGCRAATRQFVNAHHASLKIISLTVKTGRGVNSCAAVTFFHDMKMPGRYLRGMAYRIDYAVREGCLQAVVSGKSSVEHASSITRDIAEQASRQAARQLLIDVRNLLGRVGALGMLLDPKGPACRVAVLDSSDNDPYYVFSENAARARGRALRYFYDPSAALRWLSSPSPD
jgi:hypothetical protein